MKSFVLLAVCVAAVSAGFVDLHRDGSPLVREAVQAFTVGMKSAPSLDTVLGTRGARLTSLESKVQTELGLQLQQQLEAALAQIQSAIDHGQAVTQSMIDKAKELYEQLAGIGQNTWQIAQEFINILMETGQNWLAGIIANIGIGKRDFIGDLLGSMVDQLLANLDLPTLLNNLMNTIQGQLGKRGLPELWSTINTSLMEVTNNLTGSLGHFHDWLMSVTQHGLNFAQNQINNIKELALQVINNAQHMTSQAVADVIELLRPYAQDLGHLWDQILEAAKPHA